MKVCSGCSTERSVGEFSRDKSKPDGLQTRCRACNKASYELNAEKIKEYSRMYKEVNRDRVRASQKAYCTKNAAERSTKSLKWHRENRDAALKKLGDYRAANAGKIKIGKAEYRANNRHKGAEQVAARRARILEATPSWANKKKISEFYASADALNMLTGEWHHVDHIVPLRGKTVCGLHVEHNLQVITAVENFTKNNKHWPEQP